MKLARVRIQALLVIGGVFLALPGRADPQVPYFAHPERSAATVEHGLFLRLATEGMRRWADLLDASEYPRDLVEAALQVPALVAAVGFVRLDEVDERAREEGLRRWSRRVIQDYPTSRVNLDREVSLWLGESPGGTITNDELAAFARELLRTSRQMLADSKIPSSGLLSQGVFSLAQSSRARDLRGQLLRECGRFPSLTEFCATSARDLWALIEPHQSPWSDWSDGEEGEGQWEGMSLELSRRWNSDPWFDRALKRLSLVRELRTDRDDEGDALAFALGRSEVGSREITLLAMASHNHSLELYGVLSALEREGPEADGVGLARDRFAQLNHLYGLLARHRATSTSLDFGAGVKRPYHYWGGAFVACALREKNYSRITSAAAGALTGRVYEAWTSNSSSWWDLPREGEIDSRLHERGALMAAFRCNPLNP